MLKKLLKCLASAIGVLMLLFGGFVAWFTFSMGFTPMPFDSVVWKSSPSEFSHQSRRLQMADDFLTNHSPVGLTRAEVLEKLGEPDDTTYFRSYDLVYHLGQERSFYAIDSEWLVLRVDDRDYVTEARLVRD